VTLTEAREFLDEIAAVRTKVLALGEHLLEFAEEVDDADGVLTRSAVRLCLVATILDALAGELRKVASP
jgi:hypothetical protein